MNPGKRISGKFSSEACRRCSGRASASSKAKTGASVLGNIARQCCLRGGEGHS